MALFHPSRLLVVSCLSEKQSFASCSHFSCAKPDDPLANAVPRTSVIPPFVAHEDPSLPSEKKLPFLASGSLSEGGTWGVRVRSYRIPDRDLCLRYRSKTVYGYRWSQGEAEMHGAMADCIHPSIPRPSLGHREHPMAFHLRVGGLTYDIRFFPGVLEVHGHVPSLNNYPPCSSAWRRTVVHPV
eukprot:scaffold1927_cov333-Pavlova_lutheri.AAC.7